MLCPLKFSNYEFEGGQDCVGTECGMFNRCNAETEITAVEFDVLDAHAQALERENAELRKLCGANDALADENDVSEASVDANDGNADTREKLEADAHSLVAAFTDTYSDESELFGKVIRLLDRQAAITRNEMMRDGWFVTYKEQLAMAAQEAGCDECGEYKMQAIALAKENAELQARVDELTEQLETAHAKNRSLRQHIAKMQEGRHGWHVKGAELQRQVDELTAENAKLSSDELHLRQALASAEFDNATLREKLGRMLDNAHEITRIGGDC